MPGVKMPPLTMIFTTPAPRSTRSRTAARSGPGPVASPPISQQCPPRIVIGGPDATTVGPPSFDRPALDDGPPVVAEVPHRRDARAEVLLPRGRDDRLQLVGGQLGDPVQRMRAAVTAEVHVRVDEAGQDRGPMG